MVNRLHHGYLFLTESGRREYARAERIRPPRVTPHDVVANYAEPALGLGERRFFENQKALKI